MFNPLLTALVCLLLLAGLGVPGARADDIYQITVKKQEAKKKTRWSLADYYETQEKIKIMDMWLALHTPSPYEFYFSGDYQQQTASTVKTTGFGAAAGGYATIFGLEGQYESLTDQRLHALFHLRLFGYQDQGTNITLEAGLRKIYDLGSGSVYGGKISLCFNRYFGIEGSYRAYSDTAGIAAGNKLEGMAFIDFKFFRVYAKYFSESSPFDRTGVGFGGRLYF